MKQGISEIIGHARLAEGRSTEVYRALRSLLCATCGTGIAEGTLFTRRRVKGIGVRIMPQCRKCAPFTLEADRKEKSALLQALMQEKPGDASVRPNETARTAAEGASHQQEEEKNLEEEVRRRLEPALKRSRRRFK